MNNRIKISVIIPIYNTSKYIRKCIESVVSQTLKDIEIVCVNDATQDRSMYIIDEYRCAYNNIKIINQINSGVAVARNRGIEFSAGQFVCFLDSDDYYPCNDILECLYTLAVNNKVFIVGGCLSEDHGTWIQESFDGIYKDKYVFQKEGFIKYVDYQFDYGFYRFLYDRKFLIENNIYFPEYIRFQDPPFFVKAMAIAEKFYAVNKITYCYRYGHQKLKWNEYRVSHLLMGLNDNLLISQKYNFYELHRLTVQRLIREYKDKILSNIGSEIIRRLLICAKSLINYSVLSQTPSVIKMVDDFFWQIKDDLIEFENSTPNDKKIKLLISYHKKGYLFKDNILTPVHAGRALAINCKTDDENFKWLENYTIGDNTGENISYKNHLYNEMTTVYWAWKNYNLLGNPDYIGFMHYRRHFLFMDLPNVQYFCSNVGPDYYKRINYSTDVLKRLFDKYDIVCTKEHHRESVYEHYKNNHDIDDLNCVLDIIKNLYPQHYCNALSYVRGEKIYFCNMFIFDRKTFDEFCVFFFNIAFELEIRRNLSGKRLFVSEFITGYFLYHLSKKKKKKIAKFPMMIIETKHIIPVVFIADDNYIIQLAVALTSLLNTANINTTYEVLIIFSGEISQYHLSIIDTVVKNNSGHKFNIYHINQVYSNININIKHTSAATFDRLKLPSLLPNIKKCIYLDADVIVRHDLSEMFEINIDDRYIAGVRAAGYFWPESNAHRIINKLELPSVDQYVNAGVLIMNLDKMRKDNIVNIFDDLTKFNFESQDQDIINKACYGKIRVIHPKYNCMTKYGLLNDNSYSLSKCLQLAYTEREWEIARKNPYIVHYADKIKPWNDLSVDFAIDWWRNASLLPCLNYIFSKYLNNIVKNKNLHYIRQNHIKSIALRFINIKNKVFHYSREYGIKYVLKKCIEKFLYKINYRSTIVYRVTKCCHNNGIQYTFIKALKKLFKF